MSSRAAASPRLAICFLCVRDVANLDLWLSWMKGYENQVSLYAHVSPDKQRNIKHPVLRQAMRRVQAIPTRWGDTSLVRAEALLYQTAMQDKRNKFFLIASETCIPVQPFPKVMARLMRAPNKGIADFKTDVQICDGRLPHEGGGGGGGARKRKYKTDRAMQCTPPCIQMYRDEGLIAPGRKFWFCSQWKILSRFNARDFCEMVFSPRHASWRRMYAECQSDVPDEVAADETMFVNWLVLKYGHTKGFSRWWDGAQLRRGQVTAAMFRSSIIHPNKYRGTRLRGTCLHGMICEENTMFARKVERLPSQVWSEETFACPSSKQARIYRMTCDRR